MRKPVGLPPRELRTLFRDGVATGLTDQELLERFAACRDDFGELAFATLIARHGPMVMNVCRRMLRNAADADDAFQATFLVLVRRAGAVRVGTSLAPWLYGVSVRVARRAREQSSRRRIVALDAQSAETIAERTAPGDHDLRLFIDEALAGLPASFRAAIVSCYLEGLTHEEAALRLSCPVGTIRSRLARGRALLKARLERSGLGPEDRRCEPLTLVAVGRVQTVVSSSLMDITARTAARLAAGEALAAIVPAGLAQLVAGAFYNMTFSKLMIATSAIALGGLAACGALIMGSQTPIPGGAAPEPVASARGETASPVTLALAPTAKAPADDDPGTSYPIKIDPDNVREYPELTIKFREFTLSTGPVALVPIDCERGTTGAVIIGNGKFQFAPEKGKSIEGTFRAVVLRFNPADLAAIISLEKGKKIKDVGAIEMSRQMLRTALGHCYHAGIAVLIPPNGALAAVLYSKEHGDLLISDAGKKIFAFNFTSRETLYERK